MLRALTEAEAIIFSDKVTHIENHGDVRPALIKALGSDWNVTEYQVAFQAYEFFITARTRVIYADLAIDQKLNLAVRPLRFLNKIFRLKSYQMTRVDAKSTVGLRYTNYTEIVACFILQNPTEMLKAPIRRPSFSGSAGVKPRLTSRFD